MTRTRAFFSACRTVMKMPSRSVKSNTMFFTQYVSELVANSLRAHATAIAIRIHSERREIQVIDNGIGIQRAVLERIGERNIRNDASTSQSVHYPAESKNHTLASIRRMSDSFTITSRCLHSTKTFTKVYRVGHAPDFLQVEQRPSKGTTVSVHGFHEVSLKKDWDLSTICYLIAAVAVMELNVSFSIRDEERKKLMLRIAKPHNPIDVLRTLFGKDLPLNNIWSIRCYTRKSTGNYYGYVGLSDRNAMQCVFLNHRPIACPLILNLLKIGFKECLDLPSRRRLNLRGLKDENIFVLFFLTLPRQNFAFVTENGKRRVTFYDVRKLLTNVKNCTFRCLAKETTSCADTFQLRGSRLSRQTRLKSVKPVLNSFNRCNENIISPLMKRNKIFMIDLKRTVTSSIVTNYSCEQQYVENDDIKAINSSAEKSNESGVQVDQQSPSKEYTESRENEVTKETYHNSKNDNIANNISPLSEWSDWTSCENKKEQDTAINAHEFPKNDVRYQRLVERTGNFDFLPRKLHGLLQRRRDKLTNVKCFDSSDSAISFGGNWRQEEANVHPCNLQEKLCEFRLSRASIKYIKVINQINNEFIAARMTHNGIKILLMIDQHAVHERIRYENLLLEYKAQKEGELLSVNLRNPLAVKFSTKTCGLLLRNKMLLRKYGISLGSSKENTLLIRAVPKCLITNNDHCNGEKMLSRVYSLLNDILKSRDATDHTSALPLTIHNAIASEACHGAIKFGDALTVKQCTHLVKLLKYTKSPNRCAHGRPTIIPVMELSELEKRSAGIRKNKLNFASLRGQQ